MKSCPYSFVVQQWSRNRAAQTCERRPMSIQRHYQHLESRPGPNYRQLWVKGRHSHAEALYRVTVGAEGRAAQGVAQDYDLPVEAVHEAIDYAMHSQELLEAERTREEARMQQFGLHKPPFVPADTSIDA